MRGASARATRAKLAAAKYTAVQPPAPVARYAAGDTRIRPEADYTADKVLAVNVAYFFNREGKEF